MSDSQLHQRKPGPTSRPAVVSESTSTSTTAYGSVKSAPMSASRRLANVPSVSSSSNLGRYVTQAALLFIAALALFAAGFGAKLIYDTSFPPQPTVFRHSKIISKPTSEEKHALIPLSSLDLSVYPEPLTLPVEGIDENITLADYSVSYLQDGLYNTTCSRPDRKLFEGCSVFQGTQCARVVVDDFISEDEATALIRLAETAFRVSPGGPDSMAGAGPASIFDVVSGAVSAGKGFVDAYTELQKVPFEERFQIEDIDVYREVLERFSYALEMLFGVSGLQPTKPSFISRLVSDVPAVTVHDEYWHSHVDASLYGSFEHTAIIYLNEKRDNYMGGELEFVDDNDRTLRRVEPKLGRAVIFTSAAENKHRVRRVEDGPNGKQGKRYAWIFAMTCDPEVAQSSTVPARLLQSAGSN